MGRGIRNPGLPPPIPSGRAVRDVGAGFPDARLSIGAERHYDHMTQRTLTDSVSRCDRGGPRRAGRRARPPSHRSRGSSPMAAALGTRRRGVG